MGVSIYAGAIEEFNGREIFGPVIDFKNWKETILADDAEERADRGEDPFLPNPNYVENAGLSLSYATARHMLASIGFPMEDDHLHADIDAVQKGVLRALNGEAAEYTEADSIETGAGGVRMVSCGVRPGQMKALLGELAAIIAKGRQLGATHLIAA